MSEEKDIRWNQFLDEIEEPLEKVDWNKVADIAQAYQTEFFHNQVYDCHAMAGAMVSLALFLRGSESLAAFILQTNLGITRQHLSNHFATNILIYLSNEFLQYHHFDRAFTFAIMAQGESRDHHHPDLEAASLRILALLERQRNRLEVAHVRIRDAFTIAELLENRVLQYRLHIDRAVVYLIQDKLSSCLEELDHAEDLNRNDQPINHVLENIQIRAAVYFRIGDLEYAMSLMNSAEQCSSLEWSLDSISGVGGWLMNELLRPQFIFWGFDNDIRQFGIDVLKFMMTGPEHQKFPMFNLNVAQRHHLIGEYVTALEFYCDTLEECIKYPGWYPREVSVTFSRISDLLKIMDLLDIARAFDSLLNNEIEGFNYSPNLQKGSKSMVDEAHKKLQLAIEQVRGIGNGFFERGRRMVDLNSGDIYIDGQNTNSPLSAKERVIFQKLAGNMGKVQKYVDLVAEVDPDAYTHHKKTIEDRCRFYKKAIKVKLGTDSIVHTKTGTGYFIPLAE